MLEDLRDYGLIWQRRVRTLSATVNDKGLTSEQSRPLGVSVPLVWLPR